MTIENVLSSNFTSIMKPFLNTPQITESLPFLLLEIIQVPTIYCIFTTYFHLLFIIIFSCLLLSSCKLNNNHVLDFLAHLPSQMHRKWIHRKYSVNTYWFIYWLNTCELQGIVSIWKKGILKPGEEHSKLIFKSSE